MGLELVVLLEEGLGHDVGFSDDGHEVGVAVPAGDDVLVEVFCETGTGGAADVIADIEAVGAHILFHDAEGGGGEVGDVGMFFGGELFEVGDVAVGDDHEVAAIVGVAVHDDGGGAAAFEQEVVAVGRLLKNTAEEAAVGFGLLNVVDAPRRPDGLMHDLLR